MHELHCPIGLILLIGLKFFYSEKKNPRIFQILVCVNLISVKMAEHITVSVHLVTMATTVFKVSGHLDSNKAVCVSQPKRRHIFLVVL